MNWSKSKVANSIVEFNDWGSLIMRIPIHCKSTAFIANNLIFGQKILGHDSEKTTLIYLSTLDTSAVDNANSEILAALGEW